MKKDENIYEFDEFKLERNETYLEKKYKKITSLKTKDNQLREKTVKEKILSLSFGYLIGNVYGISFGLFISLYFTIKLKTNFKKQFYFKCGFYSGTIFGLTMALYSYIFFDPEKIKEKINEITNFNKKL